MSQFKAPLGTGTKPAPAITSVATMEIKLRQLREYAEHLEKENDRLRDINEALERHNAELRRRRMKSALGACLYPGGKPPWPWR